MACIDEVTYEDAVRKAYWAEVEKLEEDMYHQIRAAVHLVNERNEKRAKFKATQEEKQAELESTLAKQKADLEEQFGAELEAAIVEGI